MGWAGAGARAAGAAGRHPASCQSAPARPAPGGLRPAHAASAAYACYANPPYRPHGQYCVGPRRRAGRLLIAYKNLLRAAEHTSISMVYGLHYFGLGLLPAHCFSRWARHDALSVAHLQSAKLFSPAVGLRLAQFDTGYGNNLVADIARW